MNFLRTWRRRIATLAVALALVAAWRFGYLPWGGSGRAEDARDKLHADDSVPVTLATVRVQDVPVTIDAVGTVQALNTTTIRTQVDGRLIKLPFNEGEDVKKGDVVALIEPNLYQAAYDQAGAKKGQDEATLANARIDLGRYQRLAASNYGSQQQYVTQKYLVAQLEAQVRADQGAIDSAKTTLDYCTIHSPIDGRTGIRLVDVGNILHASDQTGILVITQLRPIYVSFTIPQQALPALQKAQERGRPKVNALRPDNATVIESGEVSVIDNQIDQTTGTARIRATFPNANLRLWPGQFVNVRVEVDLIENAITVPSPAIQRGPSGAFVYLVGEDGAAMLKNVTTGQQDENIAVVTDGLDAQAQVITTGFSRLSNGAKVRIANTAGDATAAPVSQTAPSQTAPAPAPQAAPPGDSLRPDGGERHRRRDRGTP